jgi:aminopeptidase YwaD
MDVSIQALTRHVAELTCEPRPPGSAALERARGYVEETLAEAGWSPERQAFDALTETGSPVRGINLIARRAQKTGASNVLRADQAARTLPFPQFCLGAHLDSRPETPGADDNASGVAALLEIARLLPRLAPQTPAIDLELVVFDLEEVGMLGGAEHARRTKAAGIDLRGMVSLEMIGYCDSAPGSQQLPRSLVGKYPDTGNFIAVIGNQVSAKLIDCFRTAMRRVADLPVETLAVPENGNLLQASRLSDHSPFWDAGYAALMITDTSFLRNPHYHLPSDTPETLDFHFLARVTQGVLYAARDLLEQGL